MKYNSHDLADALRQLADKLESKEAFGLPGSFGRAQVELFYVTGDKDRFLEAAKALGGEKGDDSLMYELKQHIGPLTVNVQTFRSAVCHRVKKMVTVEQEVYECDPLLTAAEEAQIGA